MSSSSFTKRQKERARQEKQRMKAERRAQRKTDTDKVAGEGPPIDFDALVRYEPGSANDEPETDGADV